MENEKKINELQEKLEQMYQERSKVENSIFRQEEKFDIRKLPETDVRYRNMVYLRERYSTLDLEIQKVKEELEKLQEGLDSRETKRKSPLQQRETELTSLETEEKTITEAEALIEKQTEKEGQDIGEN